jgi:hypothetical protein
MENKRYDIRLLETNEGLWAFEIWHKKEMICESKHGRQSKDNVRSDAIRLAERLPGYGSHKITEHYFNFPN